jgi:glutamine synthetase
LWIARYLLSRVAEKHKIAIDLRPKLVKGDWNGSGMHANFSNHLMRNVGDKHVFTTICEEFGKRINEHIKVYREGNEKI